MLKLRHEISPSATPEHDLGVITIVDVHAGLSMVRRFFHTVEIFEAGFVVPKVGPDRDLYRIVHGAASLRHGLGIGVTYFGARPMGFNGLHVAMWVALKVRVPRYMSLVHT